MNKLFVLGDIGVMSSEMVLQDITYTLDSLTYQLFNIKFELHVPMNWLYNSVRRQLNTLVMSLDIMV